MGDGGRGERVRHVVLTVQAHGHVAAPGGCVKREGGLSAVRESDVLGAYVRFAGLAEEDHPGLRTGRHGAYQRVVGVEDRDAAVARRAAPRRVRPWPAAICSRPPNSPMWAVPTLRTRPIRGGVRSGEVADVADAAGAHLQHEVPGVLGGAQRGQRQADLVVERARRADGRRLALEHLGDEVLGAGLAGGAGERDDGAPSRSTTCRARAPSAGCDVVHDDRGHADGAGGQHGDRAGRDGRARRSRGRRRARRRRRRTGCRAPPRGSR